MTTTRPISSGDEITWDYGARGSDNPPLDRACLCDRTAYVRVRTRSFQCASEFACARPSLRRSCTSCAQRWAAFVSALAPALTTCRVCKQRYARYTYGSLGRMCLACYFAQSGRIDPDWFE